MAASASESCWTPKELEAARVRDVQTIMMVGALQCSAQGYNTSFGYDRFVTRHRAELVSYNDTLKHHFMRQAASSAGERDYDGFATKLANSHSIESTDMRNYCARVDSLVRASIAVQGDELGSFSATVSERPAGVGEDCGRAVVAAADAPFAPRAVREREDDRGPGPYEVADARDYPPPSPPPAAEDRGPSVFEMAAAEAPLARDDRDGRDERALDARDERGVEVAERDRDFRDAPVEVARRAPEPVAAPQETDAALRQATAALQQATLALQAAMTQRQPTAARAVSAPASAGPRRATVAPVVLAPEPVMLPDSSQFVG